APSAARLAGLSPDGPGHHGARQGGLLRMTAGAIPMPRATFSATPRPPLVSSGLIAVIAVIVAEGMLFAGLIGSFLIFRLSAPAWPPADLPRLPLGITLVNTGILGASLLPLTRGLRSLRSGRSAGVERGVGGAATVGVLFLLVQGAEWARLVHHGVTLGTSMYGATFYVLIGCHALHVLAAVLWLGGLALYARAGRLRPERATLLETATVYWYFVSVLWLVVFGGGVGLWLCAGAGNPRGGSLGGTFPPSRPLRGGARTR